MKIGVNLKLDVTKLDKSRFFQGSKGTYCDLTAFIDTENTGQYGDNGIISQQTTKEERENGVKLPICGNVKVFYKSEPQSQQSQPKAPYYSETGGNRPVVDHPADEMDDIPF